MTTQVIVLQNGSRPARVRKCKADGTEELQSLVPYAPGQNAYGMFYVAGDEELVIDEVDPPTI